MHTLNKNNYGRDIQYFDSILSFIHKDSTKKRTNKFLLSFPSDDIDNKLWVKFWKTSLILESTVNIFLFSEEEDT